MQDQSRMTQARVFFHAPGGNLTFPSLKMSPIPVKWDPETLCRPSLSLSSRLGAVPRSGQHGAWGPKHWRRWSIRFQILPADATVQHHWLWLGCMEVTESRFWPSACYSDIFLLVNLGFKNLFFKSLTQPLAILSAQLTDRCPFWDR